MTPYYSITGASGRPGLSTSRMMPDSREALQQAAQGPYFPALLSVQLYSVSKLVNVVFHATLIHHGAPSDGDRDAGEHAGSGGERPPQVLLVGQPTRGVDIGAIEFIHGRLRALRDAGGAVLVVSSELDEILALSDRVVVMNAGRVAGELPIAQCSEAALGRLMGGAH